MIGPRTADRPMTGPKKPNALPISSSGKTCFKIPKPWGIMIAAKTPWISRVAISMPGLWAAPQSALASVKPATPRMNRRRRPKMSPRRPPVTRPMAKVSA